MKKKLTNLDTESTEKETSNNNTEEVKTEEQENTDSQVTETNTESEEKQATNSEDETVKEATQISDEDEPDEADPKEEWEDEEENMESENEKTDESSLSATKKLSKAPNKLRLSAEFSAYKQATDKTIQELSAQVKDLQTNLEINTKTLITFGSMIDKVREIQMQKSVLSNKSLFSVN